MKNCKARQYSDQMQCALCGLAWDMNDDDPPECRPLIIDDAQESERRARINELRSQTIERLKKDSVI